MHMLYAKIVPYYRRHLSMENQISWSNLNNFTIKKEFPTVRKERNKGKKDGKKKEGSKGGKEGRSGEVGREEGRKGENPALIASNPDKSVHRTTWLLFSVVTISCYFQLLQVLVNAYWKTSIV
jgi:hypothetical protein